MTEIKTSAEFVSPPATPTAAFAPNPEIGLRDAELRLLLAQLTKGEEALARRKDLTELHKRVVTMFTTLNQGLAEGQAAKAQEDRQQLVARLDAIERGVNGMEGALRIELEPLVRNIVAASFSKIDRTGRGNSMHPVWKGLILCGAIAMGAYFSDPILAFAQQAAFALDAVLPGDFGISSLFGGIASEANLVN
jgi:hypothetical protein